MSFEDDAVKQRVKQDCEFSFLFKSHWIDCVRASGPCTIVRVLLATESLLLIAVLPDRE